MCRLLPLLFALVLVVSCATMVSYEKAKDSLRASQSCCDSIAQFKYEQLDASGEVSFKLDESSAAFNFPTGKSYFKAFRLPDRKVPYRLKITSFALGEHIDKAHIFYPQVALLDEHFAVVGQSTPGDFSLSKAGMKETAAQTWGLPVKIEGTFLVNNQDAKFVLLFTTQELMNRMSHYATRHAVPVIVPGFVTAIPGGKKITAIPHSPFGLFHVEVVSADTVICSHGSEADIEPKDAITARFTARDARLFVEAVEPGVRSGLFDTVVVLRGGEVLGGTVAILLKDRCFVGRKFLSALDYIYARQMITLFQTNPSLQNFDRLELATLQAMAQAGDPTAQFHMGLVSAWGRGIQSDRSVSIDWLKHSAKQGFSPAMLALGMALSGPGALLDEAEKVGQPPHSDEFTDLVSAYFWLDAASRSSESDVKNEALFRLHELQARMAPEELKKARELVQESKGAP